MDQIVVPLQNYTGEYIMTWATQKFVEALEVIGDEDHPAYDWETYEVIRLLCRQIINEIHQGCLPGQNIETSFPLDHNVIKCLNEHPSYKGHLYFHAMPLYGRPRQVAYVIYTDVPSSSPQKEEGPGFLFFNVRLNNKAIMIHKLF